MAAHSGVGPPLAAHCRVHAPERVVGAQHLAAVESDSYSESRDPGDRTGALAVGQVFHRAAIYRRKFFPLLTPGFCFPSEGPFYQSSGHICGTKRSRHCRRPYAKRGSEQKGMLQRERRWFTRSF